MNSIISNVDFLKMREVVNIKFTVDLGDYNHNITIDKVSISPFGNQIIITERTWNDRMFNTFAIFDDKGNNLDVLNTDMTGTGFGKATNSFEYSSY